MKDEFAACWNCGKMNKKQPCGYYFCGCKKLKGSNVLWYLPLEIYKWRKKMFENRDKLFLDDEEVY